MLGKTNKTLTWRTQHNASEMKSFFSELREELYGQPVTATSAALLVRKQLLRNRWRDRFSILRRENEIRRSTDQTYLRVIHHRRAAPTAEPPVEPR